MIDLLKAVIYSLLSGITEILPISSQGHQSVLMLVFGMSKRDPLLDLASHIGILLCLLFSARDELLRFRINITGGTRKKKDLNKEQAYESRLLRSALIPMLLCLFFIGTARKFESNPLMLALFFVFNGIVLFIPDYIRQANKNAGQMGFIDSILLGLSGVACIFPGVSSIGVGTGLALVRGADKQNAFHWLFLLTIPVTVFFIIFDIISIFTIGLATISIWLVIGYILSVAAAFAGSYIGIMLMRFLSVNSGFSSFAFYSWGAAAFTFILYLIAY